jgi:hypothetical protein
MKRVNPKQLNEVEVKDKYSVKVSNRLAALENLDVGAQINAIWETM